MQPLIKWPGGKSSEVNIIKQYIPSYNRYIEPFFGGGAVFFNLPPKTSIINDISVNLTDFYCLVKENNIEFKQYLYEICNDWDLLKKKSLTIINKIIPLFIDFNNNRNKNSDFHIFINDCCDEISKTLLLFIKYNFCYEILKQELRKTVWDKINRIINHELKKGITLSIEDTISNILTGFTSGYYMGLRKIFNFIEKGEITVSRSLKIAIFYFIREFCYGSMFRYNKKGDFNIPYGGIAYNNKDLKKKIEALFSDETKKYFKDTTILCGDFENIIDMASEGDFIFLDPPYDSDFSDYENRQFGENDQRRLEKKLHYTKAKFLLVIKNTPLISELYKNNAYNVHSFDNKYSYCVKGRNDRNAVHLIVTNY